MALFRLLLVLLSLQLSGVTGLAIQVASLQATDAHACCGTELAANDGPASEQASLEGAGADESGCCDGPGGCADCGLGCASCHGPRSTRVLAAMNDGFTLPAPDATRIAPSLTGSHKPLAPELPSIFRPPRPARLVG